jgi:hypothetical protein
MDLGDTTSGETFDVVYLVLRGGFHNYPGLN